MAEEPGVEVMCGLDAPSKSTTLGERRSVIGCTPGVQQKSAEAIEKTRDELCGNAKERKEWAEEFQKEKSFGVPRLFS